MNKSGITAQVISHPQGGGSIKGLGESFSPDLHTGTGNLRVPIAVPPGRNHLQPELSLLYSSGHGNGPFGLGWALSIPGVARDTTRGVPIYADGEDTFLLSGAEQLVPTGPSPDGSMAYRPRTEGVFARIRHRVSERDDYWEVRSRNGLSSLYGHPAARGTDSAVVHDPDDALRISSWSLSETSDPFGNRIEYLYERDAASQDGPHLWDQIYLKTIRYADHGPKDAPSFLITVDFVYEPRPDPFSSYRAGFEIRTTRRCSRIEIRTHAGVTQLARIYHLRYQDELPNSQAAANGVSLLRSVDVEGVDGTARETLPPLEFAYTAFDPSRRIYQALSALGDAVPERSLAHPDFELADLFGRGLPDVVQIGEVRRYWRNLGEGRFDVPRTLDDLPAGVRLGDEGTQLADFDGDGQIDLLVSLRTLNGYLPLTVGSDEKSPFVSYGAAPPFPLNDPELRLVDLDGDGITDALRTGEKFELYHHDRELGWTGIELRARDHFDRFPDVHFSDPRVKLADMTGDGLQDIVFVNAGHVDYWPYLGNGRWGQRISMGGRLEFPDALAYAGLAFDPRRVILGDLDGDGVADLAYIESGRLTIWLNQSGNGWGEPIVIHGTPPVSALDAVRLADMLGQGSAGILWTYDLRSFADSTYKFLDLTGGTKPYLLSEHNNNSGARTLVEYASSTRFYLEDERQLSTRWITHLPFPVQVVARVEVIDELSGGKLTTEYRYHQGCWDGDEREFRGFGMVEQLDSEAFARYHAQGLHGPQAFNAVPAVRFSPPTLTRTWFHQGQIQDGQRTWRESGTGSTPWVGDPSIFSPDLRTELAAIARTAALTADPLRIRHALRSLRGSVLRSELYAVDPAPNRDRPYTVTESLYDVREIEPDDPGAAARLHIFFPFQIASRTTQWERGTDPMTHLAFDGGHDEYGLPRTQLAVAVPRGRNPRATLNGPSDPYLSTYTVTEYARIDDRECYIVDRVARSTGYEVVNDGRPSVFALRASLGSSSPSLRTISHARIFYDGEPFIGLPLGKLGPFGVPVRKESLVFESDFLARIFDPGDPLSVSQKPVYLNPQAAPAWPEEYPEEFRSRLPHLAGYVHHQSADIAGSPAGYYVIEERHLYDFHEPTRSARGLPVVTRDPLGADTVIDHDAFDLLPIRVTDPAGLTTEATYDYRVLQAYSISDPNGNSARFTFSPAGFVTAQHLRGKNSEGDDAHPSLLMEYDLLAFRERRQPTFVRTIRRVHHDSETDLPPDQRDEILVSIEYSDGFGRSLQTRAQAEDTLFGDPVFGGNVLSSDQTIAITDTVGRTRQPAEPDNVVVTGWQVYDNKGRIVQKYEPFFAKGYDFSPPTDNQSGQKATIFYEARGQAVRTVNPDGSERRVVFGVPPNLSDPDHYVPTPWESYTYDPNDNAGRTHGNVALPYASHWNTPSSVLLDPLGRAVTATARNGPDSAQDWYVTRSAYDIQGNLVSLTDALGRVAFRYVFDLAKRRWRMDSIDAGRRDTVLDALGNPVENRDSKGALSLNAYDELHRRNRLWARDATGGAVTLRQRMDYGDAGRADQPAADREIARAKNLLGQLTRHHDEAGLNILAAADFKGNVLDKVRRMIADAPILKLFEQASAHDWQITAFQVDWQPDPHQTLADRETDLLEPTTYQTTLTYDALNRVKQMTSPQDVEGRRHELRPLYNRAGGLEQVRLDDAVYVDRIAYDAKGQRALIAYGNGIMTRYSYEPQTFLLKRLRTEHYTKSNATTYRPSGAALQDCGYDYDLIANVLVIRDRATGSGILNNPEALNIGDSPLAQLLVKGDALNRRFDYDPMYRLLAATGRECDRASDAFPWEDKPRSSDPTKTRAYRERYAYDPIGNILRLDHVYQSGAFTREFTVETTNNHLRTMKVVDVDYDYGFDVNGNMRTETLARHFEWNHTDQMKAFRIQTEQSEPSVHVHYLYDASGLRAKKLLRHQGGHFEITHYIDAVFEHHRSSQSSGLADNNLLHVIDDRQRVALVRFGPAHPADKAPAVQFHLGDHLGSSNVVLDSNGALVNREEFTPYGETSFGSFEKKRYRYTAMERDEETGLTYHGARFFSPTIIRWLTCDPLITSATNSTYEYSSSCPTVRIDPAGTDDKNASAETSGERQPPRQLERSPARRGSLERSWSWIKARGTELILVGRILVTNPDRPELIDSPPGDRVAENVKETHNSEDARRSLKNKPRGAGGSPGPDPKPTFETEPSAPRNSRRSAAGGGRAKGSITTEASPPQSIGGAAATIANVLLDVAVAGDYFTQIANGDYKGARQTAEYAALGLGLARIHPALAIPLVAVGARSEFVSHRAAIEERGEALGELFDPGSIVGIHTPAGAAVAGLYAAGESTGRAVVTPVVKGAVYLGRGANWSGRQIKSAWNAVTDKIGYEPCVPFYNCR